MRKDLTTERLELDKRVVEANNQNFVTTAGSLFNQLKRAYDDHFAIEFGPGIGQEEERCEVQVCGNVYYQPLSGASVHLGGIYPVYRDASGSGLYPTDFGFECKFFTGEAINMLEQEKQAIISARKGEAGKFIEDCERAFSSVEIPNMRYKMDLELVLRKNQ